MTQDALQTDLRRLLKLARADAAHYGEQATALNEEADSLEAVTVAEEAAVVKITRLRQEAAWCRMMARDANRRAAECRAVHSPPVPVDLSRQPGAST